MALVTNRIISGDLTAGSPITVERTVERTEGVMKGAKDRDLIVGTYREHRDGRHYIDLESGSWGGYPAVSNQYDEIVWEHGEPTEDFRPNTWTTD